MLSLQVSCDSAKEGSTDPRTVKTDVLPDDEDHISSSTIPLIVPEWSKELDAQIRETSGLILIDGNLWTMNDDTDTRLYIVDTATAEIIGNHNLPGVVNRNWEEISMDDSYVYVGDFGNNSGSRKDLHILRIDKESLISDDPDIDTIWFTYSDQRNYSSSGLNQTEFDCEAFVVSQDSIYLFTKQWVTGYTTQYVLPKSPGTYTAQKKSTYNTGGQTTGATFLEEESILVVCGYSGFSQPFLYLFYNYPGYDFFSGQAKRLNIALPFHQVEGLATLDGIHYYISNENLELPFASYPQELHKLDLSKLFDDYLKDFLEFD